MRHVFRAIAIDRQPVDRAHHPLAPLLSALDAGDSLIVFPEGTRGDGDHLLPFKCGVYHLARERPGVELVPVWIDNACRILPKGSKVPVPLLCTATFGAPTRLEADEGKDAFLERLRGCVLELGEAWKSTTMHC